LLTRGENFRKIIKMLRKFASLPQLRNLQHARSISTQVCGALRSAEEGGKVTHTGQVRIELIFMTLLLLLEF